MTYRAPSSGQEAIRIFNQVLRKPLGTLLGTRSFMRLRRRVDRIYLTTAHRLSTDQATMERDRKMLEKLIRKRCFVTARESKRKITIIVDAKRNIVIVDITLTDPASPLPAHKS